MQPVSVIQYSLTSPCCDDYCWGAWMQPVSVLPSVCAEIVSPGGDSCRLHGKWDGMWREQCTALPRASPA